MAINDDALMEYQLALADLAAAQRKLFTIRVLHGMSHLNGRRVCVDCEQPWPCATRKALDS